MNANGIEIAINNNFTVVFEGDGCWEVIAKGNKIVVKQNNKKAIESKKNAIASLTAEPEPIDVYDKIVQLCKIKGMPMRQLADIIGMPHTTLASKIYRHNKKITDTFINAVAIALDVDPTELKEV